MLSSKQQAAPNHTQSAASISGGAAARHASSQASSSHNVSQALWQHPYVDIFKHFKVLPSGDWRQNKKQGDVEEIFAKEIGRKAMSIQGSISANNFIQMPHPTSLTKALGLTGRYLYLQVKSNSGAPFSLHFDFGMAERSHGVRLSVSNLFKSFNQSNGFVIQAPLELASDRWTVACIDIVELMSRSKLFPASYTLDGAHSLKSMTLCAHLQVRGVYTSDNEYDFVTLPSDMRYKFPFDNHGQVASKWPEFFDWVSIPGDWGLGGRGGPLKSSERHLYDGGPVKQKGALREEERNKMQQEINVLLNRRTGLTSETEEDLLANQQKRSRIGKLPDIASDSNDENFNQFNAMVGGGAPSQMEERKDLNKKQSVNLGSLGMKGDNSYSSGQYCGLSGDLRRSAKLNQDPIVELRHIIGYSPDRCLSLKWSRFPNDSNVVIFTSGGTLIAMDIEGNSQKRFFFGHSAPICCFDVNANGALIASAQEGKNSIIRIWEYTSGRCVSMLTLPVQSVKCVAFSADGKYLACAGKDSHNKELLVVWDITRVGAPGGGKAEVVAKQTSDFNILALKFSPCDSSRLASCGKENIRFWRIKDNGSIRGSAVVLNHHARNSVFTCLDFESGLASVDPKENESVKRLFVGSKHGMVFQVNYHTESLEATYQTNDGAIYSISVNEAFCVTGSADSYLRVWPLDFSEFFMEAKHEGTVGAVEISPDGLKVVCGTLNGSLGVLDKSNQRYRTFLRSHTDQILNMDYHLGKRIIITVSKDKTIRLWDVATSDQVYEFSSPVDQALCVAAHPTLPLFSCGFESGVLRVFDIERTCVADEFAQFNKPLQKLAYAPAGDLLVTCCVDGSVAIHNPKRQHLPIKMLHLEFPPEYVHVAFTQLIQNIFQAPQPDFVSDFSNGGAIEMEGAESGVQNGSKFAVMGDYGNWVNIYDSHSMLLSHQVQCQQQLRQFVFGNANRDLVVMSVDCRIRFYSLARFEGILLRELTAAHRGSINALSISANSGYFLTGGEDSMLKVWDYEAQKTTPYFFQAFIGHTYPVRGAMFCPTDNSTLLSIGDKDGIYLWSFHGDVRTQFAHHQVEDSQNKDSGVQEQKRSRSGSVLERLRNSKKEAKLQQLNQAGALKQGSFVLPTFKNAQLQTDQTSLASIGSSIADEQGDETSGMQQLQVQYQSIRREKGGLTYNHFANVPSSCQVAQITSNEGEEVGDAETRVMGSSVMNGYDGFGGVHDNIVWSQAEGWMAYTLHNKVIFESVKTREQTVINDSSSQLSTLALSPDKKYLAVGEGRPASGSMGSNSYIYLYDTRTRKLLNRYTFHQRGVQALAFSNNGQHLISLGVHGENNLAVWDLQSGLVVRSCLIKGTNAVNALKVDPYIGGGQEEGFIQFAVVGNKGVFNIYRYEISTQLLQAFEVDNIPPMFKEQDFVSLAYTQLMNSQGTYFAILGTAESSMTAYDLHLNQFIDNGEKKWCVDGQTGHMVCNNQTLVVATSLGSIARWNLQLGEMFPTESKQLSILRVDGPVTALVMDDLNNEGLAGTAYGGLYYINFNEKVKIRIVNKAYCVQRAITSVKFCESNPELILTNCCNDGANGSGAVKVWASKTLDQVIKLPGASDNAGTAVFFISAPQSKYALIGHQNGTLRLVNLQCLRIESTFRVSLRSEDQESLTSATFNPNSLNFALGTSLGGLFLGSVKPDSQGKPKVTYGRLDIHGLSYVQAVTSLSFSQFDPLGSLLVAFDNGVIKTWQSTYKNDVLEPDEGPASIDISESGFQRFDLIDTFDMFENPHGLDEVTTDERSQLRLLYQNKRYKQCDAKFSPSRSSVDLYLSFVSALQYIYVRNFISKAIVKRVSLLHFPTCFAVADFSNFYFNEDSTAAGGEQVLLSVGTKEGKVLTYKVSSSGNHKLAATRPGLAFGSIAAIDISSPYVGKLVASTDSGELFTADLALEGPPAFAE